MTSAVLDASALMALLRAEPGADTVQRALNDAVISAVNYSEILKTILERGGASDPVAAFIRSLSVAMIPFDEHPPSPAPSFIRRPRSADSPLPTAAAWPLGFNAAPWFLPPSARWAS